MATSTSNFGLSKPQVNNPTDEDIWGNELNTDLDSLDALLLTALNLTGVAKTANFTVTARTSGSTNTGDARKLFLCDATAGIITASLPPASGNNGQLVAFKKTDISANKVTIDGNGSEKIDGQNTYDLLNQYNVVILSCDGTGWNVLNQSSGGSGGITGISAGTGLTGGGSSGNVTLSFADITTNRIMANVSGGSAAPTAKTITETLDGVLGSTQGTIIYRSASVWTTLAPGTTGQFLKTLGAASNPLWAAVTSSVPAALAVGSIVLAVPAVGASVGDSIAGSNLTIQRLRTAPSFTIEASGDTASGTWQALQTVSTNGAGLFQRTA